MIQFNLLIMDGAIHLDNQTINGIIKIHNEISNRLLSSKFYSIQFLPTQSLPKDVFALRRFFTKLTRNLQHLTLNLRGNIKPWKIIFHDKTSLPSLLVGEGLGVGSPQHLHIMRTRLSQPRACHPHKNGFFLKLIDRLRAAITHP